MDQRSTKKGTPKGKGKAKKKSQTPKTNLTISTLAKDMTTPENRICAPSTSAPRKTPKTPRSLSSLSSRSSARTLFTTPESPMDTESEVFFDRVKKIVTESIIEHSNRTSNKCAAVVSPERKRILQKEVHSAVGDLRDKEEPMTFDLTERFDNYANKRVKKEIVRMLANSVNEFANNYSNSVINAVIRRYFITLKRKFTQQRNKERKKFLIKQRQRQRLSNARKRRIKALIKCKSSIFTAEDRERLEFALESTSYISSEESEPESENDNSEGSDSDSDTFSRPIKVKVLHKKILPWRAPFLSRNFRKLDAYAQKMAGFGGSSYTRVPGTKHSTRLPPLDCPEWATQ